VGGTYCGAPAVQLLRGNHWFDDAFRCAKHAESGGVALSAPVAVRRVRMRVDVLLAGVTMNDPAARGEAVARLQSAVAAIGGIVEVEDVRSAVGRYAAPAGPGGQASSGGRG